MNGNVESSSIGINQSLNKIAMLSYSYRALKLSDKIGSFSSDDSSLVIGYSIIYMWHTVVFVIKSTTRLDKEST